MKQSLRLLDRHRKPRRRCGLINSDEVVGRHQQQYDAMTTKYRINPSERVGMFRRLLRWTLQMVR